MAKANLQNTLVVPESTRVYPYYDDFDEDKNFKRLLFRPGNAIQARELTQIQTILQNQIERFGQHIFVNGSSVIGGEVRFLDTITLNLDSRYVGTDIDVNSFKDKTITYASGNTTVLARVIQVSEATDTDPPSLYIGKNYITGDEFAPGSSIKVQGESVYANIVATANANTKGTLAFIDDSIFFYNGFFVKTPKQTIVASKYTTQANTKIGLELDDTIITEENDSSLLDPALESSNYQAPGATRYQMNLVLAKRDLDSTDTEGFIELSRVEDGVLKKNITQPVYSEIEEVLARRTYDESGNYTVNPFRLLMQNSTTDNANNYQIVVSEGKGYILGYEFQTIAPQTIESPRARTVANVTNYNLNMNYGSYVIVDRLQGDYDISNMGLVDIHNVPYANVNTTTALSYSSTKIGSARLREIGYYSGDSNTATRAYELYLFDTRFNQITANAAGTANTPFQLRMNTSNSSATDNNAYVGATVEIIGGTSSGDVRTINAYNSVTRTANVSKNFTANTDATTIYRLKFDFSDAESVVMSQVYTAGASSNANSNITVLNKDNGQANGKAVITEPSVASLVFPLPENYIKPSSMTSRQFDYHRVYTGVQFTAGVTGAGAVQATSGEDFVGATSTSNTASTVLENFLVVITNPQTTGRPKGDQVKVKTTVSGSPEQVVFDSSNASDTFVATVYARMQITSDSLAQPRVKTLVLANTQTFTSEAAANVFINSTGSNTSIYLNTGQVMIKSPSRVYDQRESLYLSDVIAIKKIYDLDGAAVPAAGASLTGYNDVTGNYIFDNGQRDTYYDHASIRLRPGATPARGPLVICCRYFKTTTDKGYFSVDSYPSLTTDITEEGTNIGTGYAIIPTYDSNSLRDCIDFRPVRTNAANTTPGFGLGGIKIPTPVSDFQSTYDYYLGRRDLLVLTGNRSIELIQGVPGKYPQNPQTPTRSMVLYSLSVPPYTAYPSNVEVEFVENKRYTMRDIGLLDERVTNLEYYVSLSNLEKAAVDQEIRDVNGLNRSKYGIFTDSFTGHSLGDSELFDYAIAIDLDGRFTGDGLASNEYWVKSKYLEPQRLQGTNVAYGANKLTLSYTTESAISQNTATKFTPVADLLYAAFEGNIVTNPESDIWTDSQRTYVINRINTVNNLNLRRFIIPRQERLEAELRAKGMSEIDILNNWASGSWSFGTDKTLTNSKLNNIGSNRTNNSRTLLSQDQLNRLNNIFG